MLKELGSSVKATFSYQIKKMIQLDSKLTFYTNYDDVEVDWETVLNFTINRFFSTRVSFYPRYDNTVILPNGQKPDIQLKQFVSFGFSYKFQWFTRTSLTSYWTVQLPRPHISKGNSWFCQAWVLSLVSIWNKIYRQNKWFVPLPTRASWTNHHHCFFFSRSGCL